MKTTRIAIPAIIALLSCLLSGCVMRYTTVKDEPRQSVRFVSAHAAQVFYDAYLSATHPKPQSSFDIILRISLPYYHQIVPTENISFNAAVLSADSNHNKVISQAEADQYAAAQSQHRRKTDAPPAEPRAVR